MPQGRRPGRGASCLGATCSPALLDGPHLSGKRTGCCQIPGNMSLLNVRLQALSSPEVRSAANVEPPESLKDSRINTALCVMHAHATAAKCYDGI